MKVLQLPSAQLQHVSPLKYVVAFTCDQLTYISGFCQVTLLKGSIVVNGAKLHTGERTKLTSPVWSPALRIEVQVASVGNTIRGANEKITKTVQNMRSALDEYGDHIHKILEEVDCAFIVEEITHGEQEWLIAAEHQELYKPLSDKSAEAVVAAVDGTTGTYAFRDATFVKLRSAIVADPQIMGNLNIDIFQLPESWKTESVHALQAQKHHATQTAPQTAPQQQQQLQQTTTVICGAKGVGKSSFLRYLINTMLSDPSVDAVCIIDCDLGQPEFSLPGAVALHLIDSPILSPSHLNLRDPMLSYFIGDTTSKNEPELLTVCVAELYKAYKLLLHDLNSATKIKTRKSGESNSSSTSSNAFSALSDAASSSSSSAEVDSGIVSIPLLVNSDGFVRYMGSEVLSSILHTVQATHALHIATDKDRTLDALERYAETSAAAVATATVANNRSINISNSGRHSGAGKGVNGTGTGTGKGHSPTVAKAVTDNVVSVRVLQPGKTSASRISAVDLRTLRLVSYFLRENVAIRSFVRPPQVSYIANNNNSSNSLPLRGSASSENLTLKRSNSAGSIDNSNTNISSSSSSSTLDGLYIRSGSIVDPVGILAVALLGGLNKTPPCPSSSSSSSSSSSLTAETAPSSSMVNSSSSSSNSVNISSSCNALVVPFECASLHCASECAPRLLLAVMNASLVGLTLPTPSMRRCAAYLQSPPGTVYNYYESYPCLTIGRFGRREQQQQQQQEQELAASEKGGASSGSFPLIFSLQPFTVIPPPLDMSSGYDGHKAHRESSHHHQEQQQDTMHQQLLAPNGNMPLGPCVGMAVVQTIDISQQCLILRVPPTNTSTSSDIIDTTATSRSGQAHIRDSARRVAQRFHFCAAPTAATKGLNSTSNHDSSSNSCSSNSNNSSSLPTGFAWNVHLGDKFDEEREATHTTMLNTSFSSFSTGSAAIADAAGSGIISFPCVDTSRQEHEQQAKQCYTTKEFHHKPNTIEQQQQQQQQQKVVVTSKPYSLCVVKGDNLLLPAVLQWGPGFPCSPYMTSEATGEGAGQLKTRTNMKRRRNTSSDKLA